MLNKTEILRYTALLEKEYDNEIKPMLTKAKIVIDEVLELVRSAEYKQACLRNGYFRFVFNDIEEKEIRDTLKSLGYYGDGYDYNGGVICSPLIKPSFVNYNGYYPANMDMTMGDIYRINGWDTEKVMERTQRVAKTKQMFNEIRKAFDKMFVANDGAVFKRLCEIVTQAYNKVMADDRSADDNIRALFENTSHRGEIRIKVTIEKIK